MTDEKAPERDLREGEQAVVDERLRCDSCGCEAHGEVSVTRIRRGSTVVTRCSNHYTPETKQAEEELSKAEARADEIEAAEKWRDRAEKAEAQLTAILEERNEAKQANHRAFLAGAKWWEFTRPEGGTMWPSDQALVMKEAEKQWPYAESGLLREAQLKAAAVLEENQRLAKELQTESARVRRQCEAVRELDAVARTEANKRAEIAEGRLEKMREALKRGHDGGKCAHCQAADPPAQGQPASANLVMGGVYKCPACNMPLSGTPGGHLPGCPVREATETNLRSDGWIQPKQGQMSAREFWGLWMGGGNRRNGTN